MRIRIERLFDDPTPDGFINQRYVQHMLTIALKYTELTEEETQNFSRHLLFVGKKMAATWKHLYAYIQIEDSLIDAEKHKPPIENLDIQRISYSQDLFLEMDEFLVQLKSTLDYLAKLPRSIIGKNTWPDLRTFGDKGDSVAKALKNNVPTKWRGQASLLNHWVLKKHKPWLEIAISARDKINHFKDGGIDFESYVVIKTTVNGEEKVVFPMWAEDLSVRQYMEYTWDNLVSFVEEFTIGFLAMRLKPAYGYIHLPQKKGSVRSPIIVATKAALEDQFKIMESSGAKFETIDSREK
jgi:hypothetical protein